MVKVDFKNADLKAIPEGTYPATFTEHKMYPHPKADPKGAPYVALTFTLADGEFEGRKLWRNFSLAPQALWALKRTIVALDAPEDALEGEVDIDELLTDLYGTACEVEVAVQMYTPPGESKAQERNEVRSVKSTY
jgi:hypothetical protein